MGTKIKQTFKIKTSQWVKHHYLKHVVENTTKTNQQDYMKLLIFATVNNLLFLIQTNFYKVNGFWFSFNFEIDESAHTDVDTDFP